MIGNGYPTAAEARGLIERWYLEALYSVDPFEAVRRSLQRTHSGIAIDGVEFGTRGRVLPIAIGKAAAPMAAGAVAALGDALEPGVLLTKDGHLLGAPDSWDTFEASHPIPDERGVAATKVIRDRVSSLSSGDVALVLISGGGSALLESPLPPVTLADMQVTTRLMLEAGAPIQDLNAVRTELSEVKGGGLRQSIGDARCVTVILSDVLGNDPGTIASGPTIPRDSDPEQAVALLQRYGVWTRAPESVRNVLESAKPLTGTRHFDDAYVVVADNGHFVDAFAHVAEREGYRAEVIDRNVEGEARVVADQFVRRAWYAQSDAAVRLMGGELTVTVTGKGLGGRNTEFALAAAGTLRGLGASMVVASVASDGQDGAIDAAGAIVDDATASEVESGGRRIADILADSDSGRALDEVHSLVRPGPTGTNVNDIMIAMPTGPSDSSGI